MRISEDEVHLLTKRMWYLIILSTSIAFHRYWLSVEMIIIGDGAKFTVLENTNDLTLQPRLPKPRSSEPWLSIRLQVV